MMWLIWNMWILLLLAFIGGVVTGWILHGKSDEAPKSGPRGLLEPAQGPHSHASSATVDAEPLKAEPAAPKKRAADLLQETAPDLVTRTENDASENDGFDETSGTPEPETETAPVSDDLTQIKGLGPKAAAKLSENGVTSLAQIANWTADDVARMDDVINGRGRIERDDWVGQAKALSA
ncbi:helix-hairpin-helix domain-containing protein [Oceanicaulis sp.]|uniref:helix-hairpin-helix domain-containing protein n=1 Tax=Oceanicaulis sp. TaxID=1924941 RepID=UPI003D2C70F5